MPGAAGGGFVPSPLPKEIVELDSIKAFIEPEWLSSRSVGWNPVIDTGNGDYAGVAAVIDKDFASSLLARNIKADLFLISTAVEKVALNYGKPDQVWLDRITLSEAKMYLSEGVHFAKGSMAQKSRRSSGFWKQVARKL